VAYVLVAAVAMGWVCGGVFQDGLRFRKQYGSARKRRLNPARFQGNEIIIAKGATSRDRSCALELCHRTCRPF
jgi:hypothetical protein